MTTWNYRLIKHDDYDPVWYGLHEVFYNDDKSIQAWSESPILVSDTENGIETEILRMIANCLEKYDTLVYSNLLASIEETDEQ